MSIDSKRPLEWSLEFFCMLNASEDVIYTLTNEITWDISDFTNRRLDLYRMRRNAEQRRWTDCFGIFKRVPGIKSSHADAFRNLGKLCIYESAMRLSLDRFIAKDIADEMVSKDSRKELYDLYEALRSNTKQSGEQAGRNANRPTIVIPEDLVQTTIEAIKAIVQEQHKSMGRSFVEQISGDMIKGVYHIDEASMPKDSHAPPQMVDRDACSPTFEADVIADQGAHEDGGADFLKRRRLQRNQTTPELASPHHSAARAWDQRAASPETLQLAHNLQKASTSLAQGFQDPLQDILKQLSHDKPHLQPRLQPQLQPRSPSSALAQDNIASQANPVSDQSISQAEEIEDFDDEASFPRKAPRIPPPPNSRKHAPLALFTSPRRTGSETSSQRRRFTAEEENNLRRGVKIFGEGRWQMIRDHFEFNDRTNVDLKDKWRNMKKHDAR